MTAHAGFNDAVRRAAGHGSVHGHEPDAPVQVGDIGIGRGAGSAPTRAPSRAEQINASLRDAFGIVRERITVDELWSG